MCSSDLPLEEQITREAFDHAIALFNGSLGSIRTDALPMLSSDPVRARQVLWIWLIRLRELLPVGSGGLFGTLGGITLEQLTEELEDLDLGDQGSIFAATPRKAGQKAKQGKLARLRLKALCWERYFRSKGERPGEAQAKVSNAFGESWNTIEKWEKRVCVPLLREIGRAHV